RRGQRQPPRVRLHRDRAQERLSAWAMGVGFRQEASGMGSSDLAAASQALLVEARHRLATSHTLIATTLFRVTRGRRVEGASDARDDGLDPPGVCLFCKKPIIKLKQSSVKINERAYHSECWERLETRRTRP